MPDSGKKSGGSVAKDTSGRQEFSIGIMGSDVRIIRDDLLLKAKMICKQLILSFLRLSSCDYFLLCQHTGYHKES